MKSINRLVLSLFVISLLLTPCLAYNGNITVYVTETGSCYHRKNCSYLLSEIEMTLEEVVASGYRPCSRCSPPKLGEDSSTDANPYIPPGEHSQNSNSARNGTRRVQTPPETSKKDPIISEGEKESSFGISWIEPVIVLGLLILSALALSGLRYMRRRKDCLRKYAGKSLLTLSGAPPGTSPELPTVYVTEHGFSYHESGCRYAVGAKAINLADAKKYRSCSLCHPPVIPLWYDSYQVMKKECQTYRIKTLD